MTESSEDVAAPEIGSRFDVIVVGAGLSGLYALYRFRQRGWSVKVVEAAPDVGGTWYWNAYPGARCDVESMDYSYSFDPELEQEWTWSEKYASQPEILAYIRHVAQRHDLRRDISFNTRVVAADWDEDGTGWSVETDVGSRLWGRYLVCATGSLSAPLAPPFEGYGKFEGEWYQTQMWPHEPVDLEGKRVAVIGTGSSGVQLIPVVAEMASELKVFQRTPNFSIPGRNRPLREDEVTERKAHYREHREVQRRSPSGVPLEVNPRTAQEMEPDERKAEMQRRWEMGGAPVFNVSFSDIMSDIDSNSIVADFVRDKIRHKVQDPELAEDLIPTDHPFAAKRLCVDNGYFEAYNRDNVSLVNVRKNPIRAIRPRGIELADGSLHEVDVIVYALGYDAISGSMLRMNVTGMDGRRLEEEWREGPSTYLGLMVNGFPNMFTITGPGSPAVLAVMMVALEQHVEYVDELLAHMEDLGLRRIEAELEAQSDWTDHVDEIASHTVFPLATNSYYVGANVPGKPRVFSLYAAGQNTYRERCTEIAKNGYEGFILS